uniref:Neurogenic locus notch homolog protein 2-like n=1 Tax=Saccoglossus kowalevskii TaxID=10224 RepID=A0ABM0MRF6_SACKO|nr:PREDICTED: neurogenic locus notch homolog protein 2-like [Saccoglossus kowalevskii]
MASPADDRGFVKCAESTKLNPYNCECGCRSGYYERFGRCRARLIGPQEINVTACMSEAGLDCEHRCLNDTDGDHVCECNPGYRLAGDKQRCIACFDAHNVCENGGQLKWSEDHCKCFCPIPWAGRSYQECNLYSCANGGVLDYDNCRCDCAAGWRGVSCEETCEVDQSMICDVGSLPFCQSVAIVKTKCTVLCGVCVP